MLNTQMNRDLVRLAGTMGAPLASATTPGNVVTGSKDVPMPSVDNSNLDSSSCEASEGSGSAADLSRIGGEGMHTPEPCAPSSGPMLLGGKPSCPSTSPKPCASRQQSEPAPLPQEAEVEEKSSAVARGDARKVHRKPSVIDRLLRRQRLSQS